MAEYPAMTQKKIHDEGPGVTEQPKVQDDNTKPVSIADAVDDAILRNVR